MPIVILLNALPLLGVLFLDWQSFDIILLYWVENVLIGILAVARFFYLGLTRSFGLLFLGLFFTVHYGGFCMGHLVFLVGLFSDGHLPTQSLSEVPNYLLHPVMLVSIVSLLILHAREYWRQNLDLAQEDPNKAMSAPYKRIVVLHIVLIGSGFLLSATGEPVAGLLLLIVLKTAFDIRQERKQVLPKTAGVD